ncbi:MAG: hypothetical protein ACK4SN_12620, partial [Bellilinea sp.]
QAFAEVKQAEAKKQAAQLEAEAILTRAEAEAKALQVISEALKDKPELLTYQYITKLSPNIQALLLPSNAPFLFPLPELNNPSVTPTPAPQVIEPTPTP